VRACVPKSVANRLAPYSVQQQMVRHPPGKNVVDDVDWVAIGRGRHNATKI
jgi:hypothetical protein